MPLIENECGNDTTDTTDQEVILNITERKPQKEYELEALKDDIKAMILSELDRQILDIEISRNTK